MCLQRPCPADRGAPSASRSAPPPPSESPPMVDAGQFGAAALVLTFVMFQFRIALKEWAQKLAIALLRKLFGIAWQQARQQRSGSAASGSGEAALAGREMTDKRVCARQSVNLWHLISKNIFFQVGSDLDFAVDEEPSSAFLQPSNAPEVLYHNAPAFDETEMGRRSQLFYELMKTRRSVRNFSTREVPLKIVQNIIKTAGGLLEF